ncbi:MAG: serine/threonine protein kinase [Planctomycetes bacterium]|nr:serine/threonine protein kinase [Planctomycetota bacterium]
MAQPLVEFFKNILAPTGLSKYETFGKVDEGRMSVIYHAREKKTMRSCLLKIYKEDCIRIRNAIRRKQPEIDERLLSINHPNVMSIYEFGNSKDREYSAIEPVEGVALGAMSREGRLGFKDAVGIFAKVAEGLAYLHDEKGLFHRDVNPFNVVITASLEPKIIDLDFCVIEASDTSGMYRRSGTVAYLSPEQVCGKHLDHRSDIYSFGVTMYEVLTNSNPYWDREEETQQMRLERTTYNHLVIIPHPPSQVRSGIPSDLDEIVLSCLKIDKEDRIQTAAELAGRLNAVAQSL